MKLIICFLLILIKHIYCGSELDTVTCNISDYVYIIDFESYINEGDNLGNIAGFRYTASSYLLSNDSINYKPENLGDGILRTAWVEGSEDYGLGESFTVSIGIPKQLGKHRLSSIEFLNGYSKSDKIWKANSRVEYLKLKHNGKDVFIIELSDVNWPQILYIPEKYNILLGEDDNLTFEIIGIFPGTKYKDTAISEIVFGVSL